VAISGTDSNIDSSCCCGRRHGCCHGLAILIGQTQNVFQLDGTRNGRSFQTVGDQRLRLSNSSHGLFNVLLLSMRGTCTHWFDDGLIGMSDLDRTAAQHGAVVLQSTGHTALFGKLDQCRLSLNVFFVHQSDVLDLSDGVEKLKNVFACHLGIQIAGQHCASNFFDFVRINVGRQ